MDEIKKKIENLRKEIEYHQRLYYSGRPEISDKEFDKLFDQLLYLEEKYPEYKDVNSPTARVGSDLDTSLSTVEHKIPVLSLDKCYSIEELNSFLYRTAQKVTRKFDISVEQKIDGITLVLYYEKGKLAYAVTRGNGFIGNDVTLNARTIKDIPLVLPIDDDVTVRGEVYIKKNDFLEIKNRFAELEYANPRNLTAGIIRRKKSKEVAQYPLHYFAYEGIFSNLGIKSYKKVLEVLHSYGFVINKYTKFFNISERDRIASYIKDQMKIRDKLEYEIDGLVIKVDDLELREQLGYTGHHPRWAIAYKFEAPFATTIVEDIIFQVGRGGRITPVAILKPVYLSGSTISRATLHNEDYINMLEIGIGDKVSISKRGDVIPAVEEVFEKNPENYNIVQFPENCPSCGSRLVKDGAHHFCMNKDCPGKRLNQLIFFASKGMMDIQGLGEKTIELLFKEGLIKNIPDLYTFDYRKLKDFEGFKDKKINNIIESIEKSKKAPFKVVLAALGFKDLGPKVVELLIEAGFDSIDKLIEVAKNRDYEKLININGIGDKLAEQIINVFSDKGNIELFNKLKELGLNMSEEEHGKEDDKVEKVFEGTQWVITGSFSNFKPRELAAEEIRKRGGKVTSTVTSRTTYLLVGENPGSKLEKARKLGVKIVNEEEFLNMLKENWKE